MLQTSTFPFPGSLAMLDGEQVSIHQQIDGETVLVFGSKFSRRVRIAELAPPPPKPLLQRWLEERVVLTGNYDHFTPAALAADDFRDWLAKSGHAESAPLSDYIFTRMMRDAGHIPARGLWRAPGDRQARTRSLYRFVLRRG